MDRTVIHLKPLPRRVPGALPLATFGWLPRKSVLVDWRFTTWNFSLILAGEGTFRFQGQDLAVSAPAMIRQWPEAPMQYGPRPGTTWDELFLIYDPDCAGRIAAMGFPATRHPVWAIEDTGRVLSAVEELKALVVEDPAAHVDRIDRVAERLVVEAALARAPAADAGPVAALRRVRRAAEAQWREAVDLPALARAAGLSETHFRRLWRARHGKPPQRWLNELRLRQGCRQLAETARAISDIARDCGFSDPLYFSRRVRAMTGLSPRAYRERYRR